MPIGVACPCADDVSAKFGTGTRYGLVARAHRGAKHDQRGKSLTTFPRYAWETYIVSKAVGNVRNNGAELIEPVDVTNLGQQVRRQLELSDRRVAVPHVPETDSPR
jgi:hypothetical protein